MYFLSDVYEAQFARIKVARKLHNRIVNGKVFAVKGSNFWRQGGANLFEKVGKKRRVFGTAENRAIRKQLLSGKNKQFLGGDVEKNMMGMGLTRLEARALDTYTKSGYIHMNTYNFDSGEDKQIGMLVKYANKGLRKLPRATPENLPTWFTPREKNAKLIRTITVSDDQIEGFLDAYEGSIKSPGIMMNSRERLDNDVLTVKHPFSTSLNARKYYGEGIDHFQNFDPTTDTQIKYRIKRKKNTEGRWIGDLTGQYEGEILFPTGSKFKIKKVVPYESINRKVKYDHDWESKDGYEIWLDEV